MNYKDIREALEALSWASYELEEEYIDNGGECTEATEAQEQRIEALKALLTTEGIDSLGRWLKGEEDKITSLKAEKAYIDRRIKAAEQTIDFIKTNVNAVLASVGLEKIKGECGYCFTATTSVKTSVDKELLNDMYLSQVEKALHEGDHPVIPQDVTITLGASVKMLEDGADLPAYYMRSETPSCRFTKPRTTREA